MQHLRSTGKGLERLAANDFFFFPRSGSNEELSKTIGCIDMMYEPVEPRAPGASIFEKEAGGDGRGRINFELKVNTHLFLLRNFACLPLCLILPI